ncbi:MAG: TnpV protein [Clostridia bacterium]|nr:TnpV protein [Clostridia bacterium]
MVAQKCKARVEQLVKQISKKENVTEELKANNQMLWVQSINNIKNHAEEIAYNEIIYT